MEIMVIFIDINKLPRPERSGTIAIVVVYLLLTGVSDILAAPFSQSGESFWGFLCYVIPCSVLWPPHQKLVEKESEKRYKTVMVYLGKGAGKPSTVCSCHIDVHFYGQKIQHTFAHILPTCDNDWAEPRTWVQPNYWKGNAITVIADATEIRIEQGKGETRWHCTY
jgi:hypothetical protein